MRSRDGKKGFAPEQGGTSLTSGEFMFLPVTQGVVRFRRWFSRRNSMLAERMLFR